MERVSQRDRATQLSSRPFLGRLQPDRRGPTVNLFLFKIRQGLTDPVAIVRAVREEVMCRVDHAQRWQHHDMHANLLQLLRLLKAHPDEASTLAEWGIEWEHTPPGQKAQLKAFRSETHRRAWQAGQPPTTRQLAYLGRLGHAGPIESRRHASELTDQSLQGGRRHA
jgi:hypothetical protein